MAQATHPGSGLPHGGLLGGVECAALAAEELAVDGVERVGTLPGGERDDPAELGIEGEETGLDRSVPGGDQRETVGLGVGIVGAGDQLVGFDAEESGHEHDGAFRCQRITRLHQADGVARQRQALGQGLLGQADASPVRRQTATERLFAAGGLGRHVSTHLADDGTLRG